jgi:hypothetical protein
MSKFYLDYIWKKGIPYGVGEVSSTSRCSYKIPADPYRKRIAIEEWRDGSFYRVLYDSALLDFRHLQPAEQTAWQKVIISETADSAISEIRNQDDRTILIETYFFKDGLCRSCTTKSPHGILVSQQQMCYKIFDEPFDGVILKDSNGKPVMFKSYKWDEEKREFTELLEEVWDDAVKKIPVKNASHKV